MTSELPSLEDRGDWAGTVSTLTPLIVALVTISSFYLDRVIRIGGVDVLYGVALVNSLISALAGGIGGLLLRPTSLGRRLCHAILLAWLGIWSYGGLVIFGIVIIELLRFWVPYVLT